MPHQHQSLVHCFPSPTYMFFPRYHLLLYQTFSWFVPLSSLIFIIWEEVLVSYQSLYMCLLTQTGDSIKILNRVVRVYIFFCTNINNYIYSFHLPSSFFKNNIFSFMPIKSLLFSCCVISNTFATPGTITH